ncbi:MAG: FAD-dependent oxidoreductase [Elusimicrobia bacterium]|nr:FAD-dependent oxidoreductase [Elusimicrobiota bacterium]
MSRKARVVIIGSGIAGSSIAYHLAELGWKDILVLEQGEPVSGTTSHAPGLVGQLRSSASLTKMLMYSVALYKKLRYRSEPGFFPVGSLRLASSHERLLELKRQESFAKTVGLEARLLSAAEAAKMFPLMESEGVHGALYLPGDGSARAVILAQALAQAAKDKGVEFLPYAKVVSFDIRDGRVVGLSTPQEDILCDLVVAASGIWSAQLGRLAGVRIPLIPMQHQYAATAPLPELKALGAHTLPNLRDPDNLVYFRQDGEGLVLGGYERDPAPFYHERVPEGANPTVLDYTPARFESLWEGCLKRVPLLKGASLVKKVNGLESFTPDGEFILGPAPELKGFWAACGFCAHGVSGSGGVGKMLAEWIVEGEPTLDLWHMDIRRFGGYVSKTGYIAARACEVYATYYDIAYPNREKESQRKLRLSPMYGQLSALDCVFGEKSGWERPNWFASNEARADEGTSPVPRGWAAKNWSPAIGAEHKACREAVALFDESSFSKLEVSGAGALAFLQRLTDNQMDKPEGSVTYTQMLNERGGIECDLTVTRLGKNRFRLITGTAFGVHDTAWLLKHKPADGSVGVKDLTDELCCLGVWGPRARELLQGVSPDDVSNEGFPYLSAREIKAAGLAVFAVRVTYVGELGWELYAPAKEGGKLWQALWEAGNPLGAAAAGYRAIDSLRLEKGYRYWSADIHSEYNPYEAGLGFCVKLDKGDFIGKPALETFKARGLTRKLCCLTLDDPAAVALGGEAIAHAGRVVGRVTSAGYGYTLGKSIAYGYLPIAHTEPGTKLEVELFGERIPAVVCKEPLYDPRNARIKS